MKLLIDTNVVLDVLLNRAPFCEAAISTLALVQRDDITEYVSASAITDIYYIIDRQIKDHNAARELLKRLLHVVSIATVSQGEIQRALTLDWSDFEDSVQYSVAQLQDLDGIVTRDPKGYQKANIPVWSPEELLQILSEKQ